ncbi:MAG: glycosyltransferase [Terracidiphilus sp.]|nr:glycosyltransferase [Terracidiphilus sp.]
MEFIYFGNDWFAENRTSSHHIAKRLGARFPMLYVEVPGLRAPKANTRDLLKLLKKIRMTFQPPQQVAPHFWRMTLPQIPLRRFAVLRAINQSFSQMLIRRAIRRLGFNDAVAWFHVPHPGFLAKQLGEKLTVFYCIDDYSKLPDVDGTSVQAMDDKLTSAADIVFACNQSLVEARRSHNANIYLSPHGVDTEVFAQASSPGTAIPEELKSCSRPIVGSWGLIDQRVDLAILEHIARTRPEWTILLIGRVAVDASALRRMPNVIFTGVKKYAELPSWAKAIDVCILPYTQTLLNTQSSPLKLREYLASGKPIVAVPLPEANLLGKAIQTAEDGPGFVRAIEQALAEDSPELVELRQKAVEANTWEATVSNVLGKLEAELSKRQKR